MATATVIIAAAGVCLALAWVLVRLTHHFSAPPPAAAAADWIDKLCIDATELLALLDEERLYLFPAGGTRRKLRVERYRIGREHLRHLETDFKLICTVLKTILVESKQDRPDLASALVRNQMTFTYRMAMAKFQLVRFRLGLLPLTSQR